MTAAYDVEVQIKHDAAKPYRVPAVSSEARVKEIIEGFMAAWGRCLPADFRDTGVSLFVDRLAEAGHYRSDTPDALIIVKQAR